MASPIVNCPTCSKKVVWSEVNQYRPFCSAHCKQIDLGAWAEEKYVISSTNPIDDQDDDSISSQP
jgi:endogenous inhibitor of DNA gyrase (YacG/DUF329 family)